MARPTKRPNKTTNHQLKQDKKSSNSGNIVEKIVNTINNLPNDKKLKNYKIKDLVEDTKELGKLLANEELKTNQIRKFLDKINRFKVKYGRDEKTFQENKDELHLLRYQLTYAAARQANKNNSGPVEPFKKVLEAAILKIEHLEDFNRLVQFIEAIIAYHKAAGGKNQ